MSGYTWTNDYTHSVAPGTGVQNGNPTASDMPLNIKGTTITTEWMDTRDFERIHAFIKTAHTTWNASDTVDTFKLQQAKDTSGTSVKDLTTASAGGNYNTTNDKLNTTDCWAHIDARCEDMDQNNGFRYVRVLASSAGNTGNDYISDFYIELFECAHKRKQVMGAYVAQTKVYVNPHAPSS